MRESNFELLRIVSMLFIICGHFIAQSGMQGYYHALDVSSFAVVFLASGARIATLLFLLLGCWFMVDSGARPSRILKLYGQLWLYVVGITAILWLSGVSFPAKWKVASFFPYASNSLWFVCQYLNLLLLHPFLKRILCWDKRILGKMLALLFFMIVCMSTVKKFQNSWVADLLFFQFAYLFVGYCKQHANPAQWPRKSALCVAGAGVGIYVFLVFLKWLFNSHDTGWFHAGNLRVSQYIGDFKSFPNFTCACGLFVGVLHLEIGKNRFVNLAARSALAVYIIHQHPAFQRFLWKGIVRCDEWVGERYGFAILLLFVPALYAVCWLVDGVRIRMIEPLWVKSRLYDALERQLKRLYSEMAP
ncbi:MAG: hypothetical protein J6Y19_05740 [Kiritimatiellae bacterium]|nr:hypothetical protein [Kiritimatiellia bacterium]